MVIVKQYIHGDSKTQNCVYMVIVKQCVYGISKTVCIW